MIFEHSEKMYNINLFSDMIILNSMWESTLLDKIFFLATLIWVTMFDTMYAMSDKEDDLKIGINSTAILFGNRDKIIIGFFQCSFYIIFIYIGYLKEYSYIFYFFLVLAMLVGVYNQILIKKREPKFCIMAFSNNQYVGLLIFLGIQSTFMISIFC